MDEAKGVKGRIRDANRTREAILAAVAAIFAAQGFAGARLDAIAKDSGYDKSPIGQYFGDRLGLYSELLERRDREANAFLAQVLRPLLGDEAATSDAGRFRSHSITSRTRCRWAIGRSFRK